MTSHEQMKPCERSLSETEAELLLAALMLSGNAHEFHMQLPLLQVNAESTSSWPILEFTVFAEPTSRGLGMRKLADFQYKADSGLLGFFVYERNGLLAGMECWSIDGQVDPEAWPNVAALSPLQADTHNSSRKVTPFDRWTPRKSGAHKRGR